MTAVPFATQSSAQTPAQTSAQTSAQAACASRSSFTPGSLQPDWPVSARVRAFTTTRQGGVSSGAYGLADGSTGGLNLGAHCGDQPDAVEQNRRRLRQCLPDEPVWLSQVHGTQVWQPDGLATSLSQATPGVPSAADLPIADAAVTRHPGRVLVIQTADCLPVFLADEAGECVAVAHAGWRGLAQGVLERTLAAMQDCSAGTRRWHAWLGPAIGPQSFEVGDDVRDAFLALDRDGHTAFRPTGQQGKWWADLYALARRRLQACDVASIGGGQHCTVSDPHRFYSYRRNRQTGRMASLIWVEGDSLGADRPEQAG